jgi:hypothetical protein
VAYRLLADAVVLLHLAVIAFIVAGGLLARRRPPLALVHLPFAAWGVVISAAGFTCPLTPLENVLRRRAGERGYEGGFVEHHLVPLVYPEGLGTRGAIALAVGVLVVNVAVYASAIRRWRAAAG